MTRELETPRLPSRSHVSLAYDVASAVPTPAPRNSDPQMKPSYPFYLHSTMLSGWTKTLSTK